MEAEAGEKEQRRRDVRGSSTSNTEIPALSMAASQRRGSRPERERGGCRAAAQPLGRQRGENGAPRTRTCPSRSARRLRPRAVPSLAARERSLTFCAGASRTSAESESHFAWSETVGASRQSCLAPTMQHEGGIGTMQGQAPIRGGRQADGEWRRRSTMDDGRCSKSRLTPNKLARARSSGSRRW